MARGIIYKFPAPALTLDAIRELVALLALAGIECDSELRPEDLEALLTASVAEEDGESEDPTV